MTDATPAQHASQAADAIRAINHATRSPADNWQYPSDVYDLVGSLTRMAMMLPQALDQATRLIVDLNEAGHVYSVNGTLEHDLDETVRGLEEARIAADKLYGTLNRAHSGLGPLAHKDA